MVQNRSLPYGYQIEHGKTTINQEEAEVILRIYRTYAEGLSYKSIAEQLTAEDIHYIPEKPTWNKNMVARILQNENYLGTEKYPLIVENSLYMAVRQAKKPYTHTELPGIKELKPLLKCDQCGAEVKRRLKTNGAERWYCAEDAKHISLSLTDETLLESVTILQNCLAQNPQMLRAQNDSHHTVSLDAMRLQNEIDRLMEQSEIDETSLREKMMELASKRYADCHSNMDKTLEHTLSRSGARLNVSLILKIAKELRITLTGAEAMILTNENIIRKE